MIRSEKVFDLAKRLVVLQEELNEYGVNTEPLVALVEQVSQRGVHLARKEIRGFGDYGDGFEFNFSDEDKKRWQELAGITKPEPLTNPKRNDDEILRLAYALRMKTTENDVRVVEGIMAETQCDSSESKEVASAVLNTAINEPPICYEALAGVDQVTPSVLWTDNEVPGKTLAWETGTSHYIDVGGVPEDKIKEVVTKFNEELKNKIKDKE